KVGGPLTQLMRKKFDDGGFETPYRLRKPILDRASAGAGRRPVGHPAGHQPYCCVTTASLTSFSTPGAGGGTPLAPLANVHGLPETQANRHLIMPASARAWRCVGRQGDPRVACLLPHRDGRRREARIGKVANGNGNVSR